MRISAWSSDVCSSDLSKLRQRVLDVLQREGYIRGYSEEAIGPMKGIRIELKYFEGQPAIQHVARVSKPGRRVYSGAQELPRVRNGLVLTIVSTPMIGGASCRGRVWQWRTRWEPNYYKKKK